MNTSDISSNGTLYYTKLLPILKNVKKHFNKDNIFLGTYSIHATLGNKSHFKIGGKLYGTILRQKYCLFYNDDNLTQNITSKLIEIVNEYVKLDSTLILVIIEIANINLTNDDSMTCTISYSGIIIDV